MNTKICTRCGIEKLLSEFHINSIGSQGRYSLCKDCRGKSRNLISEMLSGARWRAKEKKRVFELDKEFLLHLKKQQNNKCALTGVELNWDVMASKQGVCPKDRVSMDRIDSLQGYTKDNVQLTTIHANKFKSCWKMKDLLFFCKAILSQTCKESKHGR